MSNKKYTDSQKFEIMISQVASLLEGAEADVTWNERISDPDNISQKRQIDVLVKKDGIVTLIECRLHNSRQDVQWIEELIGRRLSLRANTIIAVSSSGFTSGAIAKAKSFNINLRNVDSLSADEITSWYKPIRLSIFYLRFIDFKLDLFFDSHDLKRLNKLIVKNDLKKHPYLHNLLMAQFNIKDDSCLTLREKLGKKIDYKLNLIFENFILSGAEVKKIHSACLVTIEELPLSIPQVLIYRDPGNEKGVHIENFNLGETRIIHNENNICINLDISKLTLPPSSQFMFLDFHSGETVNVEYVELIGVENLQIKSDQIDFDINIIGIPTPTLNEIWSN